MPEGPSIVILKEAVTSFIGKKVVKSTGNTKQIDCQEIQGLRITEFKSWGKHFLICFPEFSLRVHFLLFGTYRINEGTKALPRLSLKFANGEINFYACSIKKITKPLYEVYDWSADVMSESWDTKKAFAKLAAKPDMLVCDALLNQEIFSGVGNIIKNEVLFRIKVHPESKVGKLPGAKLAELVKEAVHYSFEFMAWKQEFTLKEHWLAHTKKQCPRDQIPFKNHPLGKTRRRTFYCTTCQILYN